MINRDNTQLWTLLDLDRNSWLIESGSDSVDRHRVVRVGSISRDVADDAELAVWVLERSVVDKVRDLEGEVDAVDKDISIDDLLERSTLGRLSHIPLDDVLFRHTSLSAQINSTLSASAKSTDHQNLWLATNLGCAHGNGLLDVGDQSGLGRVCGDAWERGVVGELPSPVLECESGTGEAGVETVGCYAAPRLVDKEFEVEEGAVAGWEAGEDVSPAALVLVAMCKLDVCVDEWNCVVLAV